MTSNKILFVADDTTDGPMPHWASESMERAEAVHVITPVLGTHLERATDSDEPTRRAAARLKEVMADLGNTGADVTGEVITDPPFEAVQRMLLDNDYDRIILGLRDDTHWKEADLVARLQEITDTPVEQITVSASEK